MIIWCCGCNQNVHAVLISGKEVYSHRPDLADFPFWRCPTCRNYVGCHHKTLERTRPLGNIPTPGLRAARRKLHEMIDPLWKKKRLKRKDIYRALSVALGRKYHTADLRSYEEVDKVRTAIDDLWKAGKAA